MKMFGIATYIHQVYGHGDSGSEEIIARKGLYGTGKFPPFFTSRAAAEKYLSGERATHDKRIVELELKD